jgi:hypothetical protein
LIYINAERPFGAQTASFNGSNTGRRTCSTRAGIAVRDIKTIPLTSERVQQAYPVIQTVMPDLTLGCWSGFASEYLEPDQQVRQPHGILAAENEGGLIIGLAAYRRGADLRQGAVLIAEHLIAVDLLACQPIILSLTEKLEEIAAGCGCSAIQLVLTEKWDEDSWLVRMLLDRGHKVQSLSLYKTINGPAEA